jgi:hypothetical protein
MSAFDCLANGVMITNFGTEPVQYESPLTLQLLSVSLSPSDHKSVL